MGYTVSKIYHVFFFFFNHSLHKAAGRNARVSCLWLQESLAGPLESFSFALKSNSLTGLLWFGFKRLNLHIWWSTDLMQKKKKTNQIKATWFLSLDFYSSEVKWNDKKYTDRYIYISIYLSIAYYTVLTRRYSQFNTVNS